MTFERAALIWRYRWVGGLLWGLLASAFVILWVFSSWSLPTRPYEHLSWSREGIGWALIIFSIANAFNRPGESRPRLRRVVGLIQMILWVVWVGMVFEPVVVITFIAVLVTLGFIGERQAHIVARARTVYFDGLRSRTVIDPPVQMIVQLMGVEPAAWRKVLADKLGPDIFRICGPQPEGEAWAFPPGSLVGVNLARYADGDIHNIAIALD